MEPPFTGIYTLYPEPNKTSNLAPGLFNETNSFSLIFFMHTQTKPANFKRFGISTVSPIRGNSAIRSLFRQPAVVNPTYPMAVDPMAVDPMAVDPMAYSNYS